MGTFTMYPSLLASGAGLLSHWLWYMHGEHDNYAGIYVRIYLLIQGLATFVCFQFLQKTLLESLGLVSFLTFWYFTALWASVLIYRLLLSPIRHIPGPWQLKASKLPHAWNIRGLDNYRFLTRIHEQYGDVVRTGPNEVTFFTPEGFSKVYGPGSACTKAVYYDAPRPLTSLVNERDVKIHARWRKVWDQAFSQKALNQYEPIIYHYAGKLLHWLSKDEGKDIEIGASFERYTFDILGRLGLDYHFNLLEGQESRAQYLYHAGAKVLGPIVSIPWFIHATSVFPWFHRRYFEQNRWIRAQLEKKRSVKPELNSVMDHVILDSHLNGGFDENYKRLQGDWLITMAAGTDPMMKCLTNLMWYMADDPVRVAKIRQELDAMSAITSYRELSALPYFNGCIYETLRLNPAIPAAGVRKVAPGGMTVSGVHIPGGTVVLVPHHILFRRDDCFVRPSEFIPERWTTQTELVLNESAYHPWSAGRFSCVGKQLGLMEIRVAFALVISRYDALFAPDHDKSEMFQKTTDHFTSLPGPLHLILEARKV